VQYYRYAKSEIIAVDKAHEAATIARERNDFRLARIEREKLERAQKHADRAALQKEEAAKKAAENASQNTGEKVVENMAEKTTEKAPKNAGEENDALGTSIHAASSGAQELDGNLGDNEAAKLEVAKAAKQAMIAAAIERAKAAKAAAAATGDAPKNIAPTDEKVKQEIADIEARREAVGLTENKVLTEKPAIATTADAEKQAKIAAAIAKAKAAKAAADVVKKNTNE
jgi:Na+-translocating ferredoxin:NAD+ oxidoreductase subunit C